MSTASRSTKKPRSNKHPRTKEPRPSPKGEPSGGQLSVSEQARQPEEGRPEEPVTHKFTFYFQVFDSETPKPNYPDDVWPGNYEDPSADLYGLHNVGEGVVPVVGCSDQDTGQVANMGQVADIGEVADMGQVAPTKKPVWDGRTKYPGHVMSHAFGPIPSLRHGWCGRNKYRAASSPDCYQDRSLARTWSAKDDRMSGCARHIALLTVCGVVFVALSMVIAYGIYSGGKESRSENSEQEAYPGLFVPGFHRKPSNSSEFDIKHSDTSIFEEPLTTPLPEGTDYKPPVETDESTADT